MRAGRGREFHRLLEAQGKADSDPAVLVDLLQGKP